MAVCFSEIYISLQDNSVTYNFGDQVVGLSDEQFEQLRQLIKDDIKAVNHDQQVHIMGELLVIATQIGFEPKKAGELAQLVKTFCNGLRRPLMLMALDPVS